MLGSLFWSYSIADSISNELYFFRLDEENPFYRININKMISIFLISDSANEIKFSVSDSTDDGFTKTEAYLVRLEDERIELVGHMQL